MFRRLHLQMTIFSTLITGVILAAMTLVCLFIAESGTRKNSYTTFSNNANSCITHVEGQSLLSHQWLSQVQNSYGIKIEILDNGNPLFFDKLNPSEDTQKAFAKAKEISRDSHALDLENFSSTSLLTKSKIFKLKDYYACTALIPQSSGTLSVTILYPLSILEQQFLQQRLAFAAAVLTAVFALAVFSWLFTKKMIRPLETSRKKQTEFIASASHELRSPLAVIQSSVSAMDNAPGEETQHFISVIQKECSRMARLINDMLSLANADNHSWNLLTSPCELDTLLLETYEKYEPLANSKNLHLNIRLPEEPLPPCRCDASRVSQILAVLLDNALSYVPENGQITLSVRKETSFFFLTVTDNGPGIPDSAKEAVFQRFYRADASRHDKQHFGLGLCIAKEITLLHHGTISVTDTPGGGATFKIKLPE